MPSDQIDTRIPHALSVQGIGLPTPDATFSDRDVPRLFAAGGDRRADASSGDDCAGRRVGPDDPLSSSCLVRVPEGFKAFLFPVRDFSAGRTSSGGEELVGPTTATIEPRISHLGASYDFSIVAAPAAGIESSIDQGQPVVIRDPAGRARFYGYGYDMSLDVVPAVITLKANTYAVFYSEEGLQGDTRPIMSVDGRTLFADGRTVLADAELGQARSLVVFPITNTPPVWDSFRSLIFSGTYYYSGTRSLASQSTVITPAQQERAGAPRTMREPFEFFSDLNPAPQPDFFSTLERLKLPLNLGNWLRQGRPSGGRWSGTPVAIDATWPETTENAIVYEIDAGEGGITNVTAHMSVDNGIWVWIDGAFKFGALERGADVSPYEYAYISLGDLSPGKHYIQVLRSDLANDNGWNILITGNTNGDGPSVDTPGSFFRGDNFFFGGANSPGGIAYQTINAAPTDDAARFIDRGDVVYELTGFVGGHSNAHDSASVTVSFLAANFARLAVDSIVALTPAERGLVTRLNRLTATGPLPPGTRWVQVVMRMRRSSGSDADGYVDDLSFKLLAALGAFVQDPGLGDTHTGVVDWGDGTIETPLVDQEPGFALFLLDHVYQDNKDDKTPYTVTVTAQDDDYPAVVDGVVTGQVSQSFSMPVLNVVPEVTGVNNFFSVGQGFSGTVATFKDAGVSDSPWSAIVDWGDNTVTDCSTSSDCEVDQDNQRVTGAHTYFSTGSGPVGEVFGTVTVTDKDGGSATGYMTNVVSVATVPGVHASDDRSIDEGGTIRGLAGGFRAFSGGSAGDIIYEYTWDFGDGTSFGPVAVSPNPAPGSLVEGLTAPAHTYTDDGQFEVRFTVQALSGLTQRPIAVGSDGFTVIAANLAPVVNAGPDETVGENAEVTRTISYTDAGAADTHGVNFDWGDETRSSVGVVDAVNRTATASHTYERDGQFIVTVTVTDDDGGGGTATTTITVPNSPPTVDAGPAQTVEEGERVSLASATFADGSKDTHTATVDWGDSAPGSPPEDAEVNQLNDTVAADHVYNDNGIFTVNVCVTDNDLATGCDTTTVNVTNALPIVLPESGQQVNEGETAVSSSGFFDVGEGDRHSATVFWGDGTSSTAAVVQDLDSATATHVYANDGVYTATVRVCDDDGGCSEDTQTMRVANVPVEIVALSLTSNSPHVEGLPVTLTAVTNDKGTADIHTATIDWGDGTPIDDATVSEDPFGPPGINAGANATVTGVHRYADNGSYDVELCVQDDDATTCTTARIEVENARPVVDAGSGLVLDQDDGLIVDEGAFITLGPATFTDSGFDSDTIPSVETFTATIDWGDGTTEPAGTITFLDTPGSPGVLTSGTVQASHAYGQYGTYAVEVCVTENDHNPDALPSVEGSGCDTLTVTVNNVAPQVEAGPARTWLEGSRFTLNPTRFTDVGYAGEFTATVDWGDGTSSTPEEISVATLGGGEGESVSGIVQVGHQFGDNGDYSVEICVNDGKAEVCDTMVVTILNLDPSLDDSFLASGVTTFLSGADAFLGQVGVQQGHQASATDPGSDDLTFVWSFPPDPTSQSTTYYNDEEIGPDGLPSPLGTYPFSAADSALVTFTAPGVYTVGLDVSDDDGGTDGISLPKLVVDVCQTTKIVPLWNQFYSDRGRVWADDATLQAYLDIVSYASGVFSGLTRADAQALFAPGGNNAERKARQQALAAWLNFANGSIAWDATVPSGQLFHDALASIEATILDPDSTKSDYDAASNLGFSINRMAIGNPVCGAGEGGGKKK